MLSQMRQFGEGFYHFAKRMSQQHSRYFAKRHLDGQRREQLQQMALESLDQQRAMEVASKVSLDQFLADYFAQK